jgi:exocyst complex component 4
VDVLQEALRLVRKSEFDGIGAMTDLRTYFTNQEQSLTDILIEELHDHLYLKSPYCHDRWKGRTIEGEETGLQPTMTTSAVNSWDKPIYHYLISLNTSMPMIEDASRNPEADTFYYIHMLIETLNKLGHLDTAVNRIEQRLPVELFKVVEKTNNEIDARYPGDARGQTKSERKRVTTAADPGHGRGAVLSDFLWTVFAKFEAIAEGHRVVHDVVTGIVAREKLPKPASYTGGFKELWKLCQSEIRSLLHDYLATDGDTTLHSGFSTTDGGDVFGRKRDKNKRMFRLAEMDPKSPDMQSEQEDLDEILKSSVPGLVTKTRAKAGTGSDAPRPVQESTAAGHKLLIEPNAFNITLMLPPSLSFLQRLKDIVPSNAEIPISTLTSFLDDFLINVFHPQLEDTVSELCTKCIIDPEAFTEAAQWSKHSPRPIFKVDQTLPSILQLSTNCVQGTIAFMNLIRAFSTMLDSIPQDQVFTQLIITQLVTYFDKCFGWYKALTSRLTGPGQNTPATKAAAVFAREGEVQELTTKLLEAGNDAATQSSLIDKEIQALLSATKVNPLSAYDIISDPKSVASLSLLYNSMQWLSASLARLRHVEVASSSHSSTSQVRRWTLIASLRPNHGRPNSTGGNIAPAYLPMTTESVIPFDKILQELRELAKAALLTLHIDIRCGVILQLTRSIRGPNAPPTDQAPAPPPRDSTALATADSGSYHWILQQPPSAASALILELNNDLISFDTNASAYLGAKERKFITRGVGRLIDRVLVADADRIEIMNAYGAQRMGLDILVLQQNLRNIAITASPTPGSDIISVDRDAGEDADVLLKKSAQFYNLFLQGAGKVVDYAKAAKAKGEAVGFSYDELKVLVELCYSEGLRSREREENLRAKKGLQDSLLWLGESMWDS